MIKWAVKILNIRTDRFEKTVEIQIRLVLKDQGLHHLDALRQFKQLFNFLDKYYVANAKF